MHTRLIQIDRKNLASPEMQACIDEAAAILRGGGLVAMPTETVYGLATNALDEKAVAKIFTAKQRPAWDPVIVHIDSNTMLDEVTASRPSLVDLLIKNFWPGPLTLLLPKSAAIPEMVTAGRPLVGVRMPADPVALALIRAAGVPLAAPSANRFGHTSPTLAQHVIDDLNGRIDCILDAGPCQHGVESTVLDPNQAPMLIYRPGAITREQIETVTAEAVELYREPEQLSELPPDALPSPGVGLRHYAPSARLVLFETPLAEMPEAIATIFNVEHRKNSDAKIGLLIPTELIPRLTAILNAGAGSQIAAEKITLRDWGRWNELAELAVNLFASLRALDAEGCGIIIAPVPPAESIGAAIRDRMRKAASSAPIDRKN